MIAVNNTNTLQTHFFRVDGMHCIKCIRKVQGIGAEFQSIKKLDVNLGEQLVTTETRADFPLDDFISKVKRGGFEVKAIPKESNDPRTRNSPRSLIMKIGVAGFCAGNIMLLSTAEYLGASLSGLPTFFKYFELICFLPVLFYSSSVIYQSAWSSIKAKSISIDTPIALAVLGGAICSILNLFWLEGPVYFDSLAMFVFLLLSSRYLVHKLQSQYVSGINTKDLFDQPYVHKKCESGYELVKVEDIKVGDQIKISKAGFVPVDSVLLSDNALIDDALYTGEFLPTSVKAFDTIFAGSKNIGSEIFLEAKKDLKESRVSDLVLKLNKALLTKTNFQSKADLGAGYLTYLIVFSALAILIYFSFGHFEEGMNRALALLVVACPCGLAIALPLIQSLAVKRGFKNSLLIKDPQVLENSDQIENIVFDKTGTLTSAELSISLSGIRPLSETDKDIVYNLECRSEHPVAKAFQRYIGQRDSIPVVSFKENVGVGVSGYFEDDFYEVCFSENSRGEVVFKKNNEALSFFKISDELEESSKPTIDFLKEQGLKTYILSGDSSEKVHEIAEALSISKNLALFRQSPEDKQKFIEKELSNVLYVGDGINDSIAMSKSLVSFSMSSSADIAFKASKVHILKGGVGKLEAFFKIAKLANQSIRTIITISLAYNVVFALLAGMGFIKPLIAIVIMPLSSISITALGLHIMNRKIEDLK